MYKLPITTFIFLLILQVTTSAQDVATSVDKGLQVPSKYIAELDSKIGTYKNRIVSRTEKTLTKLSRWENRIKLLMEEGSPETASRMFGLNHMTFTTLLQQFKNGDVIMLQYETPYNKYQDELTTSLKYLCEQKDDLNKKMIVSVKATRIKMEELNIEEAKLEAINKFIKERKKQLIEQNFAYLGRSKYLTKINKETFYYTETLKNYKELFSDSKKAEQITLTTLNKIPGFQKFFQQNSLLASLFASPVGSNNIANLANTFGLQTRLSVQNLIQSSILTGGPNAQEAISQNMQQAQAQLTEIKDKLLTSIAGVGGTEGGELPDFKPNMQKTKTLRQRLTYDLNFQFGKSNYQTTATTNLAVRIGYKINDKSIFGLGASYILGMGSIQHIQLTHQGIGLQSFIDWKIKRNVFISGGYEMNHTVHFDNFSQLGYYDAWQRSALLGVSKKINIQSRWFKTSNIQVLYDFLYQQHLPATRPVIFRFGYGF